MINKKPRFVVTGSNNVTVSVYEDAPRRRMLNTDQGYVSLEFPWVYLAHVTYGDSHVGWLYAFVSKDRLKNGNDYVKAMPLPNIRGGGDVCLRNYDRHNVIDVFWNSRFWDEGYNYWIGRIKAWRNEPHNVMGPDNFYQTQPLYDVFCNFFPPKEEPDFIDTEEKKP